MADKEKIYFDTHYIKNNGFRTFFASGIFGGVTPNGLININLYTDRGPIPKKITFEVDPEIGELNTEFERDSKEGIIREVHCGILVDINTAKSVVKWLNQKIEQLEQAKKNTDGIQG